MLKSTSILICFISFFASYSQSKIVNTKTTINEVTVFLSGAEVHRKGKVTLVPGVNELKLNGLSPSINGNSVQASLSNDNLTILSVDHKMNYLIENKYAPRIVAIKDSLEDMALKYKN